MEVMSKEKLEEIKKTFSPRIQELLAEREKVYKAFVALLDSDRETRNMDELAELHERDKILNDALFWEYTQKGAEDER